MTQLKANMSSNKKPRTAITPTREEDFPLWYQEVIKAADLAENSPVRGCMTIKPYGFAIWENMQRIFDVWLKDYGVQNTAFPLLIPMEFLSREADHVEGFAKECAVVTHHRLEVDPENGGLRPAPSAKLEEPYIIRPTSETIIGEAMSRWIQSYRDLPMKLNQWCNVMRWEMRTRMFLRTSEFFWHEGHNAFKDAKGAHDDVMHVMDLYDKFFSEYLALPGIKGVKTPDETFPGADKTVCFEAMMQDGKALQAATTHDLGQNFAKTFEIKYQDKDGSEQYVHTTSWAFSSRMIGALIMVHADDDGMIMPPRIAPQQVVILPITKGKDANEDAKVLDYAADIKAQLKERGISVDVDARDIKTPDKMWGAIKKGIPLRVEVGMREVDEGVLTHVRRDIGRDSKTTCSVADFVSGASGILDDIHDALLAAARERMEDNLQEIASIDDLATLYSGAYEGWAKMDVAVLEDETLAVVMDKYSLTSRCMPLSDDGSTVIIGRSY